MRATTSSGSTSPRSCCRPSSRRGSARAAVSPRLVKHRGLAGVLLTLPLIALGGYSIIAAGAGIGVVRWIKTAENATDYSIMNTARQLLWLPTSREEKYKAKQAIDTFFVRGGDVLSAGLVFLGTSVVHLGVADFARANVVLTLLWIAVALMILRPKATVARLPRPRLVTASAVVIILTAITTPASAQESREAVLAAEREAKAQTVHPYVPDTIERRILMVEHFMTSQPPIYTFIGGAFPGGGAALGPGVRARYAETGTFDAHAAWSVKNYKAVDAALKLPELHGGRIRVDLHGNWIDAPSVAFYGVGNNSDAARTEFSYRATTAGAATRIQAARLLTVGGGVESLAIDAGLHGNPTYVVGRAFAEV